MKESEKSAYIHGYGFEEKERLIQQAYYWKDSLILKNLHLDNDKSLLEIGCGVGAVLGILGQEYPGLTLTGIELEPLQFQLADDYLEELGLKNVNLQQGNINKLPWDDNHFDYVYGIWILEHIKEPILPLSEVYRVLKPGGQIILTETDLKTLLVYPEHPDFDYLKEGLWALLARNGNPYIARRMGQQLQEIGFKNVTNQPLGFNYWHQELQEFVDYVTKWLAPTIPQMVEQLSLDPNQLKSGLDYWQNLPKIPSSVGGIIIYRCSGIK
jgi:ubiquinone/menaquinone biosynthesis C-methylase UbiE